MRIIPIIIACLYLAGAVPARADVDIRVPQQMQACATNADCRLAQTSCRNPCVVAPANVRAIASLIERYSRMCGDRVDAECSYHPPMQAACINNRCTIDYAWQHHGEPADYGAEE